MTVDLKIISLPQKTDIEIKSKPVINDASLLSLKRVRPTEMKDSNRVISKLNDSSPIIVDMVNDLPLKEIVQTKKIDIDKNYERKALEAEIKDASTRALKTNSIANSFFSSISKIGTELLMEETALGEALKDPMVFNATSSVIKNVATNSIGLTNHGIGGMIINALSSSGIYSYGAKKIGLKLVENFIPGGSFISMGLSKVL